MAELVTDVERYANPTAFAREVNLPLLGSAALPPVSPGASLSALLAASTLGSLGPIVEGLAQTRQRSCTKTRRWVTPRTSGRRRGQARRRCRRPPPPKSRAVLRSI
jgi:hypothetical protein